MAVLTPDYERMQNGQPQDYNTTKQYRKEFADQDIASAQALITNDNNYLVMDAGKLNDLCDTINYMQQIWMDDKEEFIEKYFRLTNTPDSYDSSKVYAYGDLVTYNNNPYICISEQATGSWQDYRWFRIGNDDVGLNFIGEVYDDTVYTDGQLGILNSTTMPLYWRYTSNEYLYPCGVAYPNIRYLTDETNTYTNEIYMCDWNGGEGA